MCDSGPSLLLTVTSNHLMALRRPHCESAFQAMPASDVKAGDRLRGRHGEFKVTSQRNYVQTGVVMEIELQDKASTIYVASNIEGMSTGPYVEVYGECAPPRSDEVVKLLRFRHHYKFEELLSCALLRSCRDAL